MMARMYFAAVRPTSVTVRRSWRLRFPVLWLFKCFLPHWVRLSFPVPVTLNRFLEALWVFIFGMTRPKKETRNRLIPREKEL